LLAVQAKTSLEPELIKIDGFDDVIVGRHVEMQFDAGFLEGMEHSTLASQYRDNFVKAWDGHEFVGAISKEELWEKLKYEIGPGELSGLSLKAIQGRLYCCGHGISQRQAWTLRNQLPLSAMIGHLRQSHRRHGGLRRLWS
jgi:hypothetical protein